MAKKVDSLICEDKTGLPVPDPHLTENKKYDINIRTRQTMFNNIYEALRNFVEIINYLFSHRDLNVSIDIKDASFQVIIKMKDEAPETD